MSERTIFFIFYSRRPLYSIYILSILIKYTHIFELISTYYIIQELKWNNVDSLWTRNSKECEFILRDSQSLIVNLISIDSRSFMGFVISSNILLSPDALHNTCVSRGDALDIKSAI